jgi:hypothetical protein
MLLPQIVRSVELGIPTIVMIRNPLDAAKSLKALECQCSPENMESILRVPLNHYLKSYSFFYSRIEKFRTGFILADFNEVIKAIKPTIDRVNTRFATSFVSRELTEQEKSEVFEQGGVHLSPNVDRDRIKATIAEEENHPITLSSLKEAEDIYHRMLKP